MIREAWAISPRGNQRNGERSPRGSRSIEFPDRFCGVGIVPAPVFGFDGLRLCRWDVGGLRLCCGGWGRPALVRARLRLGRYRLVGDRRCREIRRFERPWGPAVAASANGVGAAGLIRLPASPGGCATFASGDMLIARRFRIIARRQIGQSGVSCFPQWYSGGNIRRRRIH